MENAKVYFAKELMPDDVRRMYRILEKGLPVRAAEKGGQPPGKFLLPPDLSGGEDHLCSVQKQFPHRLVE